MSRLNWTESGTRSVESGVDRGVFYPPGQSGVAWNGLISVREAPSGTGTDARYFDGEKYHVENMTDSFAGSIEAFTYPPEFEPYDGTDTRHWAHQQARRPFALSYRTRELDGLGNEFFTLHIVYNVLVAPSGRAYSRATDSVELTTFSWDFTTLPEPIPYAKPSAHIKLSARVANDSVMMLLEDILYGKEGVNARLPTPEEVWNLVEGTSVLTIIDHGDGSWTAIGPDDAIIMLDETSFAISSPSAVYLDSDTYRIRSH